MLQISEITPVKHNESKEKCDLLCPLGPHTESKGTETLFCYVLALLYFDYGGQPAHYSDYNFQ